MVSQLDRENATLISYDDLPVEEMTDENVQSESLFDALKNDASGFISVHREMGEGNNSDEFVGRFPADKFDIGGLMNHVQKNYGGGSYRFRGYSKGKLRANRLVNIATVLQPTANNQNDPLHLVLAQMQKMQDQILQLANEKNTGGHSRKEMFEEMLMMKQLFGGDNKSSGIGEIVSTINGLRELGLNIGGNEPPEDTGFMGLIEKFAPVIVQAQAQQTQQTQQAPRPQQYRPNPQARPNPQPKPQDTDNMSLQLKMGIAQLVNAASKGGDPQNYVAMVMDNVSDDDLMRFFNSPNPDKLAELVKINPDVRKFAAWFTLLGEHIKANLELPSTVSYLYDVEEDDIVGDDITPASANDHEREN